MINSIQGLQNSQTMATEASKKISKSENLTENLVKLKEAEISHSANAKALQAKSDTIGTLINIKV